MKYVCVTLVGGHKLYSKDVFFKYILELNIPPEEIWISCTGKIFDKFTENYSGDIPLVHIHGEEDLGDDWIWSTTSAREAIRQYFIKSDYDWSMWLDNDILVPKDMVETFLNYMKFDPKLRWVHGYHAYRKGDGEQLRHGLGSCFIHRDILEAVPFIMCKMNTCGEQHLLGDDYIWIQIVNSFSKLNWVNTKAGTLFDVGHLKKDGTIVYMSREYFP